MLFLLVRQEDVDVGPVHVITARGGAGDSLAPHSCFPRHLSTELRQELVHGKPVSNCCPHMVSKDHYKGTTFILIQCFSCDYGSQVVNVFHLIPEENEL